MAAHKKKETNHMSKRSETEDLLMLAVFPTHLAVGFEPAAFAL